jgi:hypothetical protein
VRIECHHIVPDSEGGESTLENCIPLCFNCHADVGHYNPKHPKGTKYSSSELRAHRDRWFEVMAEIAVQDAASRDPGRPAPEAFEGQRVELVGFVWRETFPGRPNYESLETDEPETYWMLILPRAVTLVATSLEDGSAYRIEALKRLQLTLKAEQYEQNRHLVLRDAHVVGRLWPSITGHHHGDALMEVEAIRLSANSAPIDLTA